MITAGIDCGAKTIKALILKDGKVVAQGLVLAGIDTIGVHPDFQKRGIARALLMEMVDNLKKVGVDTIYTFVNWRDWDLLQFFDAMGFQRGDMINLELKI
jgi:N-acetylglutamate synthase-like GNAT family acetyltransferase